VKYSARKKEVVAKPDHIAVIWQRFLPYHHARIRRLSESLTQQGIRLTAIEVASRDASYGFISSSSADSTNSFCCFPDRTYHELTAREINTRVYAILMSLAPDVVFAPATPFPEGMAAVRYRLASGARVVIMDDAWEWTDQRGRLTEIVKKTIHKNVDAAFVPAPSHFPYYRKLGFSDERVFFGVDAVDNEYFSQRADSARGRETRLRQALRLPNNYFLFVGRFLPRKGIDTLLTAYDQYRKQVSGNPWDLVLVGDKAGPGCGIAYSDQQAGVRFAGPLIGDELCQFYGLASAMIVPGLRDQWGLVVNEAMASGLPVIVSRGVGAAQTLVREGENGWTFAPGDSEELADLMRRMTRLSAKQKEAMGRQSEKIISEWSLDRFVDGANKALFVERREYAGLLSNIMTRLWKGWVRVN